jgi:hypothetical protein
MNLILLAGEPPPVQSIRIDTRRGTPITNDQSGEVFLRDVRGDAVLRKRHPLAVFRTTSMLPVYNCHGMTFAARRTAILETAEVRTILAHDQYEEVAPADVLPGDVIIYVSSDGEVDHSGIVVEIRTGEGVLRTPMVCSKWGKSPEVFHAWSDCPYAPDVRYYRIMK